MEIKTACSADESARLAEKIARHRAIQDRLRPQRQAKMVARVAARKPDITKAKYEAAMREKNTGE